jgi:hypothetical protein
MEGDRMTNNSISNNAFHERFSGKPSLTDALSQLQALCDSVWRERYSRQGISRRTLQDLQALLPEALSLIEDCIPVTMYGEFDGRDRRSKKSTMEATLNDLSGACAYARRIANKGITRGLLEEIRDAITDALSQMDVYIGERERQDFEEAARINRPVAEWMAERCSRESNGSSKLVTLHESYRDWCDGEAHSAQPCSLETFAGILFKIGFTDMTSTKRNGPFDDTNFPTDVRGLRLRKPVGVQMAS